MPMSAPRACLICNKATASGESYCADHKNVPDENKKQRDRIYDNNRADDPIRKLYNKASWKKQFQPTVIRLNPLCQRLLENWGTGNGRLEQCHNASTEVHHFISPRQRSDLFMDYGNVAAVCKQCHHKFPGEPDRSLYVPTVAFKGPAGY